MILVAILFIVTTLVFTWPWVAPHLLRRDASNRLLDALQREWEREGETPRFDKEPW